MRKIWDNKLIGARMFENANASSRYDFLRKYDRDLSIALKEAEHAFSHGWPNSCARAARVAAELMCDHIAVRNKLPACGIELPHGHIEKRPAFVRRLVESGAVPLEFRQGLLDIVRCGNAASHWNVLLSERKLVSITEAAAVLSFLQNFAEWFGNDIETRADEFRHPQQEFTPPHVDADKPSHSANDNSSRPFADSDRPSLVRRFILIVLLGGAVWCSWEMIASQSLRVTGSWPRQFVVTPAGALLHGHVRAQADTSSNIIAEPVRGTVVTGVAEITDANGDAWVKLANGGYIKESIVRPAKNVSATNTQPTAADTATTVDDAGLSSTALPNPSGLKCSPYCYLAINGQIVSSMPIYPYPVKFDCNADWRVGEQQLCAPQPGWPTAAASPAPSPPSADTPQPSPMNTSQPSNADDNTSARLPQTLAAQQHPTPALLSFILHLAGGGHSGHRHH